MCLTLSFATLFLKEKFLTFINHIESSSESKRFRIGILVILHTLLLLLYFIPPYCVVHPLNVFTCKILLMRHPEI